MAIHWLCSTTCAPTTPKWLSRPAFSAFENIPINMHHFRAPVLQITVQRKYPNINLWRWGHITSGISSLILQLVPVGLYKTTQSSPTLWHLTTHSTEARNPRALEYSPRKMKLILFSSQRVKIFHLSFCFITPMQLLKTKWTFHNEESKYSVPKHWKENGRTFCFCSPRVLFIFV